MSLHFLEPDFLYLLIPLATLFIFWIGVTAIKISKRPNRTYGSKYPLIGKIKLWGLFVIPAGVLMVLALAKPSFDQSSFRASQGDVEVILVVDRSISMRADDIKPSRLEIAKREAVNVESLLREDDKAALFIFGKESHRKIYLSGRFETTFDRLARISFPESLAGDGLIWDSDFATMLENIYQSMDRQDANSEGYSGKNYVPKKRSNRIVIIFSDGEDQLKKEKPVSPEEIQSHKNYLKRLNGALAEFKKRGLKIYPVGIGTQKGVGWTSLLRDYDAGKYVQGEGSMYYDAGDYSEDLLKEWKDKITRLDKENLMFLSRQSGTEQGNKIWSVENSATTVKDYLQFAIDSNRRTLLEFSQGEGDQDLWQYFLLSAVGILGLGILFYPVSGYFKKNKT
ncbi:MAG: hypothetical protein UT29_C0002G0041 [Candidatus Yanofskybacteria bacterium GW2011_GWA1_39_13]|uniref:VWFA domain-containing protein n=1 Tax=Yanofskybacteria sp. (strain GW2011_GWA1_39_13) TaxID=1619019 RepID=A0A0G0MEG7_YANXG|nr:MAG: hypothetical protein UT29_C0002G0041 [Candidatus Yanofskybacteria bacterium GW2011_GWA1_39_13]